MIRTLVALCLLAAGTTAAAAIEKSRQQNNARPYGLELPAPGGYCDLSTAHAADQEMVDATEQLNAGHNRVLSIFAECGQLAAMRADYSQLSNYGSYLAPLSAGDAPLSMSRAELLDALGTVIGGNDPFGRVGDILRDRITEADMAFELQDVIGLGLLDQDDRAVYTGALTRTVAEDGAVDVTAVVAGMTLVAGRIVSLNLAAPYEGKQTVSSLLDQQRDNLRRLIEAN